MFDIEAMRAGTTRQVTIRGQAATMRLLSSHEQKAIREAFPRPEGTSRIPDGKGGWKPDGAPSPEAAANWLMDGGAAEVAISVGWPGVSLASPKDAAASVRSVLSESEIMGLASMLRRLEEAQITGGPGQEGARGN